MQCFDDACALFLREENWEEHVRVHGTGDGAWPLLCATRWVLERLRRVGWEESALGKRVNVLMVGESSSLVRVE